MGVGGPGDSSGADISRGEAEEAGDISTRGEGRDTVIVRLPAGMGARLADIARRRGVPRNTVMVAALERAVREAGRRR